MVAWLEKYWKTIAAALGAVAVVVISALSDNKITNAEWVQIALAVGAAVLVYVVPNVPQWPQVKAITSALLAALGLLASYLALDNHLTSTQWFNVVALALSSLGVVFATNKGDTLDQLSSAPGA